jgi:rhodanese-related sulfurtransferase
MKEITTSELQERLEKGEQLNLVDVREVEEVAKGMIPGAIHIPLGDVPVRMSELDSSKSYILICRSSGRSGRAAEFLGDEGYDVTNMVGGMLEWEGATE